MLDRSTIRFVTCMLLTFVVCSSFDAQSLPAATPPESSIQEPQVSNLDETLPKTPDLSNGVLSKGFARELLRDERSIWTSPARIKPGDVKWLAPLAAGTA